MLVNGTEGVFEIDEPIEYEEELSNEMKQIIQEYIIDFLTEGDGNDNGTD